MAADVSPPLFRIAQDNPPPPPHAPVNSSPSQVKSAPGVNQNFLGHEA